MRNTGGWPLVRLPAWRRHMSDPGSYSAEAGSASGAPSPIGSLGRRLLDLILPPQCLSCRGRLVEAGGLCPQCWTEISFIGAPCCPVTGIPFGFEMGPGVLSAEAIAEPPDYHHARVVARYDEGTRPLVHALKYRDRLDVAGPMGVLMAHSGRHLLRRADFLIPVPLYRMRLWRRRYNQSAELARAIGRYADVDVRHDLLQRVRPTRPQVGLTASQRRRNVEGAFAVADASRSAIAGKRVVLVDDVITTGATVNACASALRRACAEQVDVLAFARVVDRA